MTDIKEITVEAKSAFSAGNYSSAFHNLWKTGVSNFVAFGQKEDLGLRTNPNNPNLKCNWFSKTDSAKYFWENFILTKNVFNEIFSSESAEQILHNYFTRCNIQVHKFEQKLASEYPEVFLKAIRTNQVFLKADRIDCLTSIQLDKKFQLHQKVWKKIFEMEHSQWNEIEEALNSISKFSLNKILSECIIWLETMRFRKSNKLSIHHLASIYSFFIHLVFSKYPEKDGDLSDHDNFIRQFLKTFTSTYSQKPTIDEKLVSKLLNKISRWIDLKDHVINPYSFNLNLEPIQRKELVYFNLKPESYYRWLVDGVRYEVNKKFYYLKGSEFVEHLEKEGIMKVPGNTEEEIELNRNLAISTRATMLMLSDLKHDTFYFSKKSIYAKKLLNPLQAFSVNRLSRYENRLIKLSRTSQNWHEAYKKLANESINANVENHPFFLMSVKEYELLNNEALPDLPKGSIKAVVNLFSWKANKNYPFNKFSQPYNVWQKPFYKIGDYLFCPMIFFANNEWFYSFAQAALTHRRQPLRSETQSMENDLAEKFKNLGWKVKLLTDQEVNDLPGDIDIFVEDGDTLVLIQLKRTYFRLDSKDTYYEVVNSDFKAAKQLNEAEKYLVKPNSIFEIRNKPVKWIVSTSFENIGESIDGCIKINYFELFSSLNTSSSESLKFFVSKLELDKKLKEFIAVVKNKDLSTKENEIWSETIEPLLTVFESKNYMQPFFSEDEGKTIEYKSLFDEALRLDHKGLKNEALVMFKKCIMLEPNIGDAFGAIANVLADMRLYDYSFVEFKKALALLPNDPYISRNYSLALIEAGKYYEGLQLVIDLYEKFPLLGDFKVLFEKNFEKCLKDGLLDTKEILDLHTKWDKLK